jgi:hypothetical protein
MTDPSSHTVKWSPQTTRHQLRCRYEMDHNKLDLYHSLQEYKKVLQFGVLSAVCDSPVSIDFDVY